MNSNIEATESFFAPMSADFVDSLVDEYETEKSRITTIANFVNDGLNSGAISWFIKGNCDETRGGFSLKRSAKQLFDSDGAINALNSFFWTKAIDVTDVMDYMPKARRDEWHESIRNQTCPMFEENTVRDTLIGLLNMRHQFLAERVDGIFRGLSGEHVTNSPQGFNKRMIISGVLNEYWSTTNKVGLINDLRCVIAKFMGRDEPKYMASSGLISSLKYNWGQWVTVDGGALKIRVYKKGTAHLEVHPDMAWRLNATLAHLYPHAIPSEFRVKPKKQPKSVKLMDKLLPFAVIEILANLEQGYNIRHTPEDYRNPYKHDKVANSRMIKYVANTDKHILAEAEKAIAAIGGVKSDRLYLFGYEPTDVLNSIISSGCIPDYKSHQFYPTPESIAQKAVELADIQETDFCLEPSAGIGNIADLMPIEKTVCVEISKLHCQVLQEKKHITFENDFLQWHSDKGDFDKIIMNPPYDRGQWQAHLEHAATMLKKGGKLVAILPASAKNKADLLPELNLQWHDVFSNEFANTSISVIILVAEIK